MFFNRQTQVEQQVIPALKPLVQKPEPEKRKRPKLTKKDRLGILGILFFTILGSLFFYLKAELPGLKEKIKPLLTISGQSEVKKFNPSPILNEIKNLTASLRGTYGLYVYRSKDGQDYGLNQEEVFPAASLMKLPVILTLYQQAEADKIDLDTNYQLQAKDKRGGAGILQGKPVGSSYSYRELANLMGQYSDNTANNILINILGSQLIQKKIADIGLSQTSWEKYTSTPHDMGLFFRKLYQGEMVNTEHRREILEILTNTNFEDRIPAGVPSGIKVAHKIGTEMGVYADAGIVFAPQPFVLVIMSKSAKEAEAMEVLPKIVSLVWDWETEGSEH
jgi:beta-lactamase class A